MKINMVIMLGIVAVIGVVTLAGCGKNPEPQPPPKPAGLLDKTGAALNDAGKKTGELLQNVGK